MKQSSDLRGSERDPTSPPLTAATLAEVDIRSELRSRPFRLPDYDAGSLAYLFGLLDLYLESTEADI